MSSGEPIAAGQRKISIDQAFQLAHEHHGAGRLKQAGQLATQITRSTPRHPGAWQLLAVIAHQTGQAQQAIELMSRAIQLNPTDATAYANRGEMHRLTGNLERAIADGEQAVKLNAKLAQAHSNLGIALYDKGDLERAERCQFEALRLDANYAQALNNMGSICRDQRNPAKAQEYYQRALSASPGNVEATNNLAAVTTERDKPDEALKILTALVRQHPGYAEAHSNIGNAFMAKEDFVRSEIAFSQALKLRPGHPEALEGLARTHIETNRLDQARTLADQVVASHPDRASAHSLLASVLSETGFHDQAASAYEHALALKPDQVSAWLGKGHLLLEMGDMEGAAQCFEKAGAQDPDNLSGPASLMQTRKTTADDPAFVRLQTLADDVDEMSDGRATSLHFALGKGYEDTGDYDRAFEHFFKGCTLKRKRVQYSADNQDMVAANIRKVFNADMIKQLSGGGDPSDLPVFVLGMPRSGTTLTETILASHPNVFAAGELPDLLKIAGRTDLADNPGYPLNCENLDAENIRAMGADYVQRLRERDPQATHITDKMPANFLAIGLIHLMLPNARIVHVKRNPVDTCVSAFSKLFNRSQPHTYDMTEMGRYYRHYLDIMAHWHAVLPKGSFYEIQYEDLVANQEEESRKLIEYCGLEWDEACMQPHKTERKVKTASVTQVRRPVYTSSVERWRRYEKHLGPLLQALGDAVPKS